RDNIRRTGQCPLCVNGTHFMSLAKYCSSIKRTRIVIKK
uniref:Uncharacterized protein n=1 Tax=Solanum lycopersicum TaxID=4081 RepID=A0A3Q7H454_SOLLC